MLIPLAVKKIITLTHPAESVVKLDAPGEYVIELAEPDLEVEVVGIFESQAAEIKKVQVTIHHQAPRTLATTTLKGVARDQSQLSLLGKIVIDANCGQSNSFLTERVLLLSDQSRAETVPELEIMTDDVKCSHAASISSIPEDQLFYLQSRGLSVTQAENLIVTGFLKG